MRDFRVAPLAASFLVGLAGVPQRLPPPTEPAPVSTAIVRGRIVASDTNAPLRDALVSLQSLTSPPSATERMIVSERTITSGRTMTTMRFTLAGSTSVDAEGQFEISGVVAGQYRLLISPGPTVAQYIETRYPNPGSDDAAWLDVAADQVVDGLVIPVLRGAVISGRVVDDQGSPQVNVAVTVRDALAGENQRTPPVMLGTGSDRTDDLGGFRVFGLQPREYIVIAQPPRRPGGPIPFDPGTPTPENPPTYYAGTLSAAEATKIRVRAGEEYGPIELTLQRARPRALRGMLLDSAGAPAPNSRVVLQRRTMPLGEGIVAAMRTAADGTFEFKGVPTDDHALSASLYDDSRREYAWMPVSPDADLEPVTLRLQPGAALEGDLVFEDTRPESLMSMLVRPVSGIGSNPSPAVQPNADGSFALEHLFGPTLIRVDGLGAWHLKAVLQGGRDITDEQTEFTPGELPLRIILTRGGMAALSGVIVNARTTPTDAAIVLFSAKPDLRHTRSTMTKMAFASADGRYRVTGVRPGRYLAIAVPRDGVSPADLTSAYLDRLEKHATPVEIRGTESSTLDLRLTRLR